MTAEKGPPAPATSLPPGPHDWMPGRLHLKFLRDPLGYLQKVARDYGDVALLQREPELKVLLNHPDHIKDVLVTHSKSFVKSRVEQVEWRALMGEGLLDSDGDYHLRQRRLMEPSFHRERIARYAAVMVAHALRLEDSWQAGQTLDMQRQMMHLALSISGKTLLGADVDSPLVGEVDRAFRTAMRYVKLKRFLLGRLLVKLPLPAVRHFHEAMASLDAIFHRVIAEHRAGGQDQGDLLSTLIAATDGEGSAGQMTDKQLRDEVATLFIAGYETTANALTWTWYLLSQNPHAEARLHAELQAVLAGRPPHPDDVPHLVYTEKVFREALRLYPPPWAMSRRAIAPVTIGGYVLPADTVCVISPYVLQRDPRFFPEPERFDPDRWTPAFKAALHPYAYIPFGGGPRKCIGESFAWTEATLAIAAIAQKWRLRLAPGQKVVARPVLQIRPRYGMRMVLERRETGKEAGRRADRENSEAVPAASSSTLPPGPRQWFPGRMYVAMLRDILGYLTGLVREYGDIVHVGFRGHHLVIVNHPDLTQDLLVTHARNFHKNDGRIKLLLGNGLLTSEDDFHLRQRRLMQPAFHRDRIAGYGRIMVDYAAQLRQRWQAGSTVDVLREMMWLTQVIVARALFNADIQSAAGEVTQALTQALSSGRIAFRLPFRKLLESLHLPGFRHFYEARDQLDTIIYRLISEHRQSGQDQGDLLSTMLRLSDEGGGMSDQQLRDEMLTLFLAGHETTANALTWTWYLLAHNAEAEARLHAELDTVLGGRLPAVADVPRLPYTEKVFREAMRLYPPVPMVARQALQDHPIGGYVVPAGTVFLVSPYLTQHDARFYTDPERFNPDRWTAEFRQALPHFAYFPFSGGPRQCIGESFAWMEGILLLATLAQQWRLRLAPDQPPVRPKLAVTLRPWPGVHMIAERRETTV